MESIDLLVHSAGQLCVVPPHDGPQRGAALGDLGLLADGAVAVDGGRIVAVGPSAALRARFRAAATIDAGALRRARLCRSPHPPALAGRPRR